MSFFFEDIFKRNHYSKEGPEAVAPLLWWRPTATTFVVAMNRVDAVDLVVDLVDVDLDVYLVDVDLDVVDLDVVPFC